MHLLERLLRDTAAAWEKEGIAHGEIRPVIGAVDETFLQRLMLVFMDLATGYLLMEEVATDRSFDTGFDRANDRLKTFGTEVLYLVSDRAKALIKLAHTGLGCPSIPDLFHLGHALAKGVTPEQLIAELYGREAGCSHGRGGSMHLFAPEVGLMGTSGIVGACILQAAGAGYTFKLLKTERVAVAFFGDGAVNNGAFHEGLNLASIWQLPAIFVCENNMYATEVPFAYAARNTDVASRGAAYGLPGVAVDGNDVLAVYAAAQAAVERARAGGGPTLLECRTYRTRSHAEGMRDVGYRTREEVESWKARDPLPALREQVTSNGLAVAGDFDAIDAEVKAQVAVSATFSTAMDAGTITGTSFTLTRSGGSPVAATVTYDSATSKATLTPSASLVGATTYTAALAGTLALGTSGSVEAKPKPQ